VHRFAIIFHEHVLCKYGRCAVIAVNWSKNDKPVMKYFTEIATWILKCTFIAYHCVPLCALEFWGGGTVFPRVQFPRVLLHFNHCICTH